MKQEIIMVIDQRIDQLNKIIEKAYTTMPDVPGRLRVGNTNGFPKYFHLQTVGDKQGKYIKKRNKPLIKALAKKGYNEKIIQLAEGEVKFLQKMITDYPKDIFENYLDSLSEARRIVIDPIWLSDEEFIRKWLSKKKPGKGFNPEDKSEFITNSGLRVRSKSEVNIANCLDKYHIPYLYEQPLYLKGVGWVYPDFTILVPKRRKIIIWEHHGLLDDRDYRENNFLRKNAAYAENGFFPGINLIQTFESQKTPLSIPMIEKTIQSYLI